MTSTSESSVELQQPRENSSPQSRIPQQPDYLPDGMKVLRLAGRGTFCDVWQVSHATDGTLHALKILRREHREQPAARKIFLNDTEVAGRVRSPYAARASYSGESGGIAYSINEWIEGSSFEEVLQAEDRLDIGRAVWVARQCAAGLLDLADAGYSHGDLKPSNVLLTPAGIVKLIDFGFARRLNPSEGNRPSRLFLGTPDYLAPESLTAHQCDPIRRDMYSLGMILFRALTGRLPFPAESPQEVLRHQRQTRPPSIRRWCPTAPQDLSLLVNRLLAKQPLRRPSSWQVLLDELMRLEILTLHHRFAA